MIKFIFLADSQPDIHILNPVYPDNAVLPSVEGGQIQSLLDSPATLCAESESDKATFWVSYQNKIINYFTLMHYHPVFDRKYFQQLKQVIDDILRTLPLPADTLIVM